MLFLERDSLLQMLAKSLDQMRAGQGNTVLISGEAGIGKTSLVEHFISQQSAPVRMLWGACESLFTPRPLGPLYDMSPQMGAAFQSQLAEQETHRVALFSAFLQDLQESQLSNLLIVEDAHWADESTLDWIKFLGRRLQRLRLLLIVTYRDDEVGPEHPLRSVIGELPSKATVRLKIPPLSEKAVAMLAEPTGRSAHDIYRVTGGNPFFVTELLADTMASVPSTVRDAVLARAARLSPLARSLVEAASVVPNRVDLWLLQVMFQPSPATLDECFHSGMLHLEKDAIAFRHELARQAIESTLTPPQRQSYHMHVLRAWQEHGVDPGQYARVLHHAVQARDHGLILRYAPMSAQYAASHGAHREAASHYATLLVDAGPLSLEQRAGWLEDHSYECYLTGQIEEAEQSRLEALNYWVSMSRQDKVGFDLRWLSRLNWFLGRSAEAERYAIESVRVLESLPPSCELAMSYSNMSQLRMLAEDMAEAVQWGNRAISLAETYDDLATLVHALNNVGAAQLNTGNEQGRDKLERSLALSLERHLEEHAARAYTNLASVAVVWRNYPLAMRYLEEGIAYTAEHDLDSWRIYMRTWRARALLETGQWDDAALEANSLLSQSRIVPTSKISALVVLALVRMRRGDPGAWPILDEARSRGTGA